MKWIEQFSKGTFGIYAGQPLEGFQPIDYFHYYPLWYDLWIDQIADVMDKLDLDHKSYQELSDLLPPPSNMLAIVQKTIPSYQGFAGEVNKENLKKVTNFLARMLLEVRPNDPFCESSNPSHNAAEVKQLVDELKWRDADEVMARKIGQLIAAAGSFVHGLYNDLVTDFGWEGYGPYRVDIDGKEQVMLIRHFPDMIPRELWSDNFLGSVKDVKVYTTYEGVEWKMSGVGCHTILLSGSPVQGMRKYAVLADGKSIGVEEIDNMIGDYSSKAEALYREIKKKDFEGLKEMVIQQECYQLKKIFDEANVDWKPTDEMMARVKGKELVKGMLPYGKMMETVDEYREVFGINKFEDEVLKE